jgi:chromosome segregation ATPase
MAIDPSQSKDVDLDRTDRLPILQGISIDEDIEDDAVHLEYSSSGGAPVHPQSATSDFSRPSALDLPSLAQSVRSVEERIARQNADYEALNRLYEKARDAQLAAGTRADTLAFELAAAQSTLAVEQHRVREMERVVAESRGAADTTRGRVEEALRETERAQTEARTLRDSLAARDATVAQVVYSLGERDAQLHALQREHAQIVPTLEARSRAGVQLESELQAARGRAEALDRDLKTSRQSLFELVARFNHEETELAISRRDLIAAKAQSDTYLETLRSREWRGAFNQNLFREWDEKEDAARSGQGALQAECDQLRRTIAALNTKILEHGNTVAKMQAAAAAEAATFARKAHELQESQRARAELHSCIEGLEADRKRLEGELEVRGRELGEARTHGATDLERVKATLAAAEAKHTEQAAELEQLRAEAVTHDEEMTVLMAHLNEARRPIQGVQSDIKRLSEELALKKLSIDELAEENRTLRATLERTRGALEERELLIRRLERNASTNANALGRLQTSIERLGSAPAASTEPASDFIAELVRLDGDQHTAYPLARRTRIGRTPGCELQIDSQSVSRNHAVLLKGSRALIVEDLNSTNGVLVNGRKVSRHALSDGDVLTIGETQFRCVLKFNSRSGEAAGPSNLSELRPVEPAKSATSGTASPEAPATPDAVAGAPGGASAGATPAATPADDAAPAGESG